LLQQVSDQLKQKIGGEMNLSSQRSEARNDAAWLLVQQADKFERDAEAAFEKDDEAGVIKGLGTADSLLAIAEAKDPEWYQPGAQRAFVAFRQGRLSTTPKEKLAAYQTAIGHATRMLQRDSLSPQAAAAYEFRGSAGFLIVYEHLLSAKRESDPVYEQAVRDLERATTLDKRRASAWMMLSSAYVQKPDLASSKLAALSAYEADPFNLSAASILDRLYRTSYITETFGDADRFCTEGRQRFPADHRFIECALWTYTVEKIRPTATLAQSMDTVWMLADSIGKLAPPNRREFVTREARIIAAIVLGRLGKADSATKVLDGVMNTPADADPGNDLLYYNAYARLTLDDKKTAIQLLKTYLTRNPEHREGWGKDSAWWWRDLLKDPEFQRLIKTGS
jgi:hypothetical protein